MLDFVLLIAAAMHQPVPTGRAGSAPVPPVEADKAARDEEILVLGRRLAPPIICRREATNSAESRIGQIKICLTSAEWSQRRDEHLEFYNDVPRRNPRKGPSSTAGPAVPGRSN